MSSIEEAKEEIKSLIPKSKFEKMVQFSAVLTKLLSVYKIKPIIVGGLAVEIYTRSDYSTVDIDVIVSDRKLAGKILSELGFVAEGRHWFHESLLLSIEIPNDMLEGADEERIIKITLPDHSEIYVIGIEDIILDRLRACIHWKSSSDCEWGKRLFLLHKERLDMDYLVRIAETDLTITELNAWLDG
jgi:hypothetical protein